jgi:hypothetical protein
LLSVNGTAGKTGGGMWLVFSDRRLKDLHGSYDKGLSEILALQPVVFNYKVDNPQNLQSDVQEIDLVAQEVVSSGGNSESVPGFEVSWTVGEPVIATLIGGTNTLTQGFHQTKITVTAVTELLYPGMEIKVFPNPTEDYITIHFSEFIEGSRYALYDLEGRLLENKLINSPDTEIGMTKYASGQYILKLLDDSKLTLQTFKVIKR